MSLKLRVTRKTHTRRERECEKLVEKVYREGDTFIGTERELKSFRDRLEAVDKEAAKPANTVDRGALFARAKELGLNLPNNIKTDKLLAAVADAEAQAQRLADLESKSDDELLGMAEGLKLDDIPTDRDELIAAIIEAQDGSQ